MAGRDEQQTLSHKAPKDEKTQTGIEQKYTSIFE
jgi:hypothetical protein